MSPLVSSSTSTPTTSSVNLPALRTLRGPSAVTTVTTTTSSDEELGAPPPRIPDGTLRLRGGPVQDRRVTWGDDVIDNEGLGRKKSKVCCIFHRAREFDESSDESSSSDSSSDESDNDDRRGRRVGAGGKGCSGGHDHSKHKGKGRTSRRQRSPNAYERMPKQPKKE